MGVGISGIEVCRSLFRGLVSNLIMIAFRSERSALRSRFCRLIPWYSIPFLTLFVVIRIRAKCRQSTETNFLQLRSHLIRNSCRPAGSRYLYLSSIVRCPHVRNTTALSRTSIPQTLKRIARIFFSQSCSSSAPPLPQEQTNRTPTSCNRKSSTPLQ